MTTTTPDSRARIAYTAYCRQLADGGPIQADMPTYDQLPEKERDGWLNASRVIWEIATTGRSTL